MTDTTATDELAAMRRIVTTLDRLDIGAPQIRVVAWIWERYMGVPHDANPRPKELT